MSKNEKLKIFSDASFNPENYPHIPLLYSFWGYIPEQIGDTVAGRFDELNKNVKNYVEIVPIYQAEVAVFPSFWNNDDQKIIFKAEKLSRLAKKHGIPMLIFHLSDDDRPILIDNSIVFRASFYRSNRLPTEYAMPGWSSDYIQQHYKNILPIQKKKNKPVVGYAGTVDYQNFIDYITFAKMKIFKRLGIINYQLQGRRLRGQCTRLLKKDPRIDTNFILRSKFTGSLDLQKKMEFIDILINSDYALVVRGAGNFSYRLYEALSCGRIPVFIDTDCVLPYDHIVDWKKYFIWIESSDINSLSEKILEFHEKISAKEFEDLQAYLRNLYLEWISPLGFHKNIYRIIRK